MLEHMEQWGQDTYMVLLLIIHERNDGPTGVGVVTGLATDTDGSIANSEMVNGAGDSTRRGRH